MESGKQEKLCKNCGRKINGKRKIFCSTECGDRYRARQRYYRLKQRLSPEEFKKFLREGFRKYYRKHREARLRWAKDNLRRKKETIMKMLGGKCAVCGATEDLVFHHLNYSSKNSNPSFKALKKGELTLVCKKHHRAITYINELRRDGHLDKIMKLLNETPCPY
jgi:hypothetical protein